MCCVIAHYWVILGGWVVVMMFCVKCFRLSVYVCVLRMTANLDSKAFAAAPQSPHRDSNDPDYYHNNC